MLQFNEIRGPFWFSFMGCVLGMFSARIDLFGQVPVPVSQGPATGSQVSVAGQKLITVKPTRLRLVLPVQVEGRDAREAVKEIASLKEHVKSELISMNADASKIFLESNTTSSYIAGGSDPSAGGRVFVPSYIDTTALAQFQDSHEIFRIHVARSTVQADWILPTDDLDALSLLPEELKKQIQERDLQGKMRKLEWTEEEREMADNYSRFMTQQRNAGGGYYTSQRDTSIDVQIFFVGILSLEEEKSGLSEAYQEALFSAELVADAAGRKLGELRSLNRSDSAASADSQYYVYDQFGNQTRGVIPRLSNREVLSLSPNKLHRNIVISATFALEGLGSK